jgi:hypothetical protein
MPQEKARFLSHKFLVILEIATVSGVFGARQAMRQINQVAAGRHLVGIAVRY